MRGIRSRGGTYFSLNLNQTFNRPHYTIINKRNVRQIKFSFSFGRLFIFVNVQMVKISKFTYKLLLIKPMSKNSFFFPIITSIYATIHELSVINCNLILQRVKIPSLIRV